MAYLTVFQGANRPEVAIRPFEGSAPGVAATIYIGDDVLSIHFPTAMDAVRFAKELLRQAETLHAQEVPVSSGIDLTEG